MNGIKGACPCGRRERSGTHRNRSITGTRNCCEPPRDSCLCRNEIHHPVKEGPVKHCSPVECHVIALSVVASSAVIYPFVTALSICVSVSRPCFLMLSKKGYIALAIAHTPDNASIASCIAAIFTSSGTPCFRAENSLGTGIMLIS